jgi:3-oxoadipate CoA-transferase beta subunit
VSAFSIDQMAERVARDIAEDTYVNLGIGLPTRVADHLRRAICHSENGILGMVPTNGTVDPDLINASKEPVAIGAGGAFFDHAQSFAMIRAGYIDVTVMGAYQVSARGDLANWSTGEPDAIPAVGGAMDLATGAKQVFVIMRHATKAGEPRIVETCTYPLTAARVVDRIYTDLAVIAITEAGLEVEEMAPGVSADDVRERTAAKVRFRC